MSLPELAVPRATVEKCFIEFTHDSPPSLYGTPVVVAAQCPNPPPAIQLAPGLLSRAVATISDAFTSHSGSLPVDDRSSDQNTLPVTVICSPHVNSLVAVDAAVRHIAHQIEADIIILDPSDLAAGRRGVFGDKLTDAFWQLYNYHYDSSSQDSNSDEDEDEDELSLDLLFDRMDEVDRSFIEAKALVQKFLLLRSGGAVNRRRILYLRDYGALCKGLSPLLPALYDAASSDSPTMVVAGISPIQRVERTENTILRKLNGRFLGYLSQRHSPAWRKPSSDAPGRYESLEDIFTAMFVNRYQDKGIASRSTGSVPLRGGQSMELRFTRLVRVGLLHGPPRKVQDASQSERQIRFLRANLWHINRTASLEGKSLDFDINQSRETYRVSNSASLSALESSVLNQQLLKHVASGLPLSATFVDVLRAHAQAKKADEEWQEMMQSAKAGLPADLPTQTSDPIVARVREMSLDKNEKELLGCIIDPATIQTTFADVCVKPEVIDTLRTSVMCRLLFPEAFTTGVLAQESMGGVLLFGPPGTGKTMACRALAKESGARMLKLQASSIQRQYLGETEQMIAAAFRLARHLGPCILFIDELEALFSKREDDSKPWHRTMVTEFTQEMDGLNTADANQKAGVIVVGASNRPQDIDSAVLRRLSRRILVDLPTLQGRKDIITHYLKGETCDESVDIEDLASRTPLFSGSDLRYLVHAAAIAALKDVMPTSWYVQSVADGAESPRMPLAPRVIAGKHFEQALKQVSASSASNRKELDELRRWENESFQSV